ncbi:MAG: hypothetical protein VYA55_20470 [Pseudomonadota bacterium]|nr:hypothetical protein [Pseudomonadota bacterium]
MPHAPSRKTVLCTWELGGQLGHIARLAHIAQALNERDYHCYLALKDLSRAAPFFRGDGQQLLQAPVFLPKIRMQRPVLSLADTLLLSGYLHAEELTGLTRAWTNLIELAEPDLLLMDYSPTAALAARHLPCKKIMVGAGFWQPVPGHPIRSWLTDPSQAGAAQQSEQRVVHTINQVLGERGQPPIQYIADLFAVERTIINTPPEFDLYGDIRQDGLYYHKSGAPGVDKPVQFGPGPQPKILAYLKPGHPQFDAIVEGLSHCNGNVYIACPRGDEKRLAAHQSEHFRFSVEPVQLAAAMAQADLFIGHGNSGTTLESILSGTPMLVLPIQLEQLLTAQTLHQLKLGQIVTKVESAKQFTRVVNDTLGATELRQNAQAYAQQHAALSKVTLGQAVANQCDELLA